MAETEKKQQQAREAREAREAEKQQVASTDWYAAVDTRVHAHFKDWAWAAIDERIRWWFDHYFDGLDAGNDQRGRYTDEIAKGLAGIRELLRGEFRRADEEQQRALEAKLAVLEERLASNDRILIETTGGPQGQARLREELKRALEETVNACGQEIAALERRLRAVPGKLPIAKDWIQESVTYQAEFVAYEGSLWQACKDTAQAPGGSDWICVARGGHDGLSPSIRGAFNVYKKYAQLDVVEYDGASYVARRDNPGVCPGDGWQSLSRSGRRGPAGETGPRGKKGEKGEKGDAPEIVGWHLERETYRAFPVFADGKMGPELNLRPLFEQFVAETSYAAE